MGRSHPGLVHEQEAHVGLSVPSRLSALLLVASVACTPAVNAGQPAAPEPPVGKPGTQLMSPPPACKCPRVSPLAPVAPSTSAASSACSQLPLDVQRELRPIIVREVRSQDEKLDVQVDFPCSPLAEPLAGIVGLQVYGHGGSTRVVQLEPRPGKSWSLRMLRVRPDDVKTTAAAPSPVEASSAQLPESALAAVSSRARAALAARITARRKPPPPGQVDLGPIETSDRLLLLELRLRDGQGTHLERTFAGYVGNLDAIDRVPVQLAWQSLAAALPESPPTRAVEEADRALLRAVWSDRAVRPWYAEQGLLALATGAGSPELLPHLVAALDSEQPYLRELAVTALAAVTGWDARFDAAGAPRPLDAVVAEYRHECTRP
jgi:hypothetical protein